MYKFKTVHYSSASEFLDALRPGNFHPENKWDSNWCFRGHGDAEWKLKPSAWRWGIGTDPQTSSDRIMHQIVERNRKHIDALCDYYVNSKQYRGRKIREIEAHRITNLIHTAFAEFYLVNNFREMLGKLGLDVFEFKFNDYSMMKFIEFYSDTILQEKVADTIENWVSTDVARAQHHGIPTRYLDWTTNPLVAAYFAAESVIQNTSHIAVYGIERTYLQNERVVIIGIPSSASNYLHSQSGLFTYDRCAEYHYIETGNWPSLTDKVEKKLELGSFQFDIFKYTLPVSEVGELLRLLWLENITRAHLMPTIDNIVSALKTRWKFEEFD